jgi:hypothetical protein
MKYFNLELLNAELNRLADRGAVSIKLKQYLNKFLEEYLLDEKTLREEFSGQPLPPNDDYGFDEQSQNLPQ